MQVMAHLWHFKDDLQESDLSSHHVSPVFKLRSSGLVADLFTHRATPLALEAHP